MTEKAWKLKIEEAKRTLEKFYKIALEDLEKGEMEQYANHFLWGTKKPCFMLGTRRIELEALCHEEQPK